MKRIYTLLLALLTLAACQDGNDFGDDRMPGLEAKYISRTLEISTTFLTLSASAQTASITVTSNSKWTATSSEQWCTVSPTTNALSVSVTENTAESSRQATITVTAGDKQNKVTVTQEGITLTVSSLSTFSNEGGTQTLTVTCNTSDWTPTSDKPSWCHVEKKSDTSLAVTCDPNTTANERIATITVQAGEVTKLVTVTQKGKTAIDVNPFDDDENWD